LHISQIFLFSHMPRRPPFTPIPHTSAIPVFKLYGEHEQWPTPDMVHCETIAARSKLHNWQIGPHQHHGLFQLLYLKVGSARVRIDDHEKDMEAGQVVLVPQMCIHGFHFARNAGGNVLTLAYPLVSRIGADAGNALLALRKPCLHKLPQGEEGDDVRAHFAAIDREYRNKAAHRELLLEALLAGLLAWLARQITPPAAEAPHGGRGTQHLAGFCQMIEAEYARQHAVSWYASQLGITAAHLNALCRQASGQSALDLVHERLLLEAKRSLVYTAMPVSAISYALGFADPAYFTRFFKQRIGLSPKAFRVRASSAFNASSTRR
jgi:AraC family transcriptional regulator, transcriptional activator of pobA